MYKFSSSKFTFFPGNTPFMITIDGKQFVEAAPYSDAHWDSEANRQRKWSGLYLPLNLTIEQANQFIEQLGENSSHIYQKDLMDFYIKLNPKEKDVFILKDRAKALIKYYEKNEIPAAMSSEERFNANIARLQQ